MQNAQHILSQKELFASDFSQKRTGVYSFSFGGQEKDDEIYGSTGTSYTAQFWQYDSRIGRRWNLDPKPDPSISYYVTFADNPIWFTDPLEDSQKGYTVNENGDIQLIKNQGKNDYGGDKFDVLFNKSKFEAGNKNFNEIGSGNNGLKLDKGILNQNRTITTKDPDNPGNITLNYFIIKNTNTGNKLFEFLATNANKNIEWSYTELSSNKTKNRIGLLATSHRESYEYAFIFLLDKSIKNTNSLKITSHSHNHPNNTNPSPSDKAFAKYVEMNNNSDAVLRVLTIKHGYTYYNSQGIYATPVEIRAKK